jgi:hypothetical protein
VLIWCTALATTHEAGIGSRERARRLSRLRARLRGHGNSAWAPGALYSVPNTCSTSLCSPISLAIPRANYRPLDGRNGVAILFRDVSDKVAKLVAIEGVGVGPLGLPPKPAVDRVRKWIEKTRNVEQHALRTYLTLAAAVARMKEPILFSRRSRSTPHAARHQLECRRIADLEV